MPQSERRLYEPSEDVRFFDGGQDEFEEEGSRLPLLIIIALVVLGSFAGVVWLAYTQGVQRGREDAPRILAEQSGRGFTTNPYSQLQIYQQHKQQESTTRAGNTPTPNMGAPKARHAALPNSESSMDTPESVSPVAAAPPKAIAAPPRSMAVSPQSARVAVTPPSPAKSTPGTVASAAPHFVAPAPTAQPNAMPPGTRTEVKAAALPNTDRAHAASSPQQSLAPTSGALATSPAGPAVQSGEYVLQIGSYTSSAEASASWQTFKGAHASVAGYAPDVQQADLGKKGTWYRLRVGPFATMAEASAACAKLKAQGGNCFPAKR